MLIWWVFTDYHPLGCGRSSSHTPNHGAEPSHKNWDPYSVSLVQLPTDFPSVSYRKHNIATSRIHKQVKFSLLSCRGETLKMKHEQPYVIPHQFVLKSAACVMLCAEPQMCVLEVLANDTLKYVIIKKLQYFSKKSSSLQRSLTPADWDSNSNSQTTWAGPYLLWHPVGCGT